MEERIYLIMKRDGTTEPIDEEKLKLAILKSISMAYDIKTLRSFKPNISEIYDNVIHDVKELLDLKINTSNRNEAVIAITMLETIVNRVLSEAMFDSPDIKLEYK